MTAAIRLENVSKTFVLHLRDGARLPVVSEVSFFSTLPCVVPCEVFQDTSVPFFNEPAMRELLCCGGRQPAAAPARNG